MLEFLYSLHCRRCSVCVGVCSKIGYAVGNGVKKEDHLSYAIDRKGTQCLQPKSNSFNYETE